MTEFPSFIRDLPIVDIGVPEITVYVMVGSQSVALIEVNDDATVAPHRHGAQWGVILEGELELSLDGEKRNLSSGDDYFIPGGVEHRARLHKGCRLIEFYEEHNRFVLLNIGDIGDK